MSKKLINDLIKAITFIPGLLGLSNIVLEKSGNALSPDDWKNGIRLEEVGGKNIVSIAVIIENDINAKMISKEISSSVKQVFKKNNIKLADIKIFIRGIK